MAEIVRKSLINRSALGFWCVNAVQGCSHGCRYPCHAFLNAQRFGRVRDYGEWCVPRPVSNALDLLDKELRKRSRPDRIHLSLTTDPFMMGQPEICELSIRIIERINHCGIPCTILTKGILPIELGDHGRFHPGNIYGISLVSCNESFRKRWEPAASTYAKRIESLRVLHERGCLTRVQIEPYPTPTVVEQDVRLILCEVGFVDSVYFSGWNYNTWVVRSTNTSVYYASQARIVRRFCCERGIDCEVGCERMPNG